MDKNGNEMRENIIFGGNNRKIIFQKNNINTQFPFLQHKNGKINIKKMKENRAEREGDEAK